VLIQGWLVLIRYSTVYTDCLDLKNMAGQPIVSQMCETGECVDVEIPTSSFTGAMGDNVRVCLSNSGICSGTVLVDQPSGEGYCAGTPAAQLLCDDKDFCTTDSCDPIEGCVHTPIEPCGDMTLIYDDTSVSDTVDGEGCDGVQSQIQCLSGSVAVGYGGKSGQYLDEFRLRCRHLYGDGTLGASSMTAPLGAGLAGDDFGPLSCPGDAVMVGATVHAASNLHSVHGHCQAPMSVATGVEGFVAFAPQAGGAGGAASAVNCPVGYAVTGMKGPSTDQACSLQFICTRIDLL